MRHRATACCLAGLLALASIASHSVSAGTPPTPDDFVGRWDGSLAVGGDRLRIVLHVDRSNAGQLEATLDSPDQGATDIPVATVEIEDDRIRFDVRVLGAVYEGRLVDERRAIDGEWRQSGQVLPLQVRRMEIE